MISRRRFVNALGVGATALVVSSRLDLHGNEVAEIETSQDAVGEVTELAAALPWFSYPPNHILREDSLAGHVASVLAAKGPRTSAEYFFEVPLAGTYRVTVEVLHSSSAGIFQASAGGDDIGQPVDLYMKGRSRMNGVWSSVVVGNATFLRAGNMGVKFLVIGKNTDSTGYELVFGRITLTPAAGFLLLSPNGTVEREARVLLRWADHARATGFEVVLDGTVLTRLSGGENSCCLGGLTPGKHRWWVNAIVLGGAPERSNTFTFHIGPPTLYPYREFTDDFDSGNLKKWSAAGTAHNRALIGRETFDGCEGLVLRFPGRRAAGN